MQHRFDQPVAADPARRRWLTLAAAATLAGCASKPPDRAEPDEWHHFVLPGKRATRYTRSSQEGKVAWLATADASASLWRRRLRQTPVTARTRVEFSWWVPALIAAADLTRAEAADAPVRVAFAFDGDVSRLPLRSRMQFQLAETLTGEAPPYATLMYVWDNHAALESILPGARSDRVRKIVVERGDTHLRQWRNYRRALKTDYERAFQEPPGTLIGVALLTDTDNTGGKAHAWYGDVVVRF